MKNTIPSPFFVVSLFVARLRWCHGSRGGAAITTREYSRPLYSGTKLQWTRKPTRTEPYRNVTQRAVPNRTVPFSGKAPIDSFWPTGSQWAVTGMSSSATFMLLASEWTPRKVLSPFLNELCSWAFTWIPFKCRPLWLLPGFPASIHVWPASS